MDTKLDLITANSPNPTSDILGVSATERRKTSPSEIHAALRRLQQWAAHTPPTALTRKQAASIASREPHYLSYLFRREMGKSFISLRREHRAAVAIAALEEGTRSINEIVKLVGYRSRRSLERAVKSTTGRTAGSIRRMRRNDVDSVSTARKEST